MLIKEKKKADKAKAKLEESYKEGKEEKEEKKKFKSQLGKFLVANEDEHFNFQIPETFLISSGSLKLDLELDGGFPPGIHRFSGASEGGKTSAALLVIKNFLETVENSKALYIKAEGRLSKKIQKKTGIKFVDNPDDWVPGTCFIFKCNVYEPVAQLIQDLITINPEGYKYSFLLDSLDGLNLREDLAKSFIDGENARVCGSPTITKRLFRRLSLAISELCHLFITISQIAASIPAKFDPREQLVVGGGGGNASIHFSSFSLKFLPHYKGDMITSDGKASTMESGANNNVGHWAKVKLDKTENENTGTIISYPIRYATETDPGGVWTEKEIKEMALIKKLIGKEDGKNTYMFQPWIIPLMVEAGIEDMSKGIVGNPKLDLFFDRPEVIKFWIQLLKDDEKELI